MLKPLRSVFTFQAKPCMVQNLEHFTPKAQIFRSCGVPSLDPVAVSRTALYRHTAL